MTPRVDAATVLPAAEPVRVAAAELLAADPGLAQDPSRWRDAAVLRALGAAESQGDAAAVLVLARDYDQLLGTEPTTSRGRVVLTATGVTERRRRGSFATPASLAAVLAGHALPAPAERVVDPACGAGSLLLAALERLVDLRVAPRSALGALHGVDDDPVAVALCRAALAARAGQLDDEGATTPADGAAAGPRIRCGDALLGPTPGTPDGDQGGLIWHEEFPDALARPDGPVEQVTGWRGGFDAVLANPPWERLKVFRREGLARDGDLRRQRAGRSRAVRSGGRYPLTGHGEVNAYLPFAEACWRLLAPHGRAGLLVPAGISADRSAAALMAALLDAGALEELDLLSTRRAVFDGVSARVGVAVLVLRHGAHAEVRMPQPARVAVEVEAPAAVEPHRVWRLDPDLPALVNPNTETLPLCGSAEDAELLAAAHRRWPVLRRRPRPGRAGPDDDPWQVRLLTPLHMTRDAVHFRPAPGPGLLPVWEAKHAGLLDHRGGSRAAHRYWADDALVQARFGGLARRGWFGAYRNVTTTDSPRTLVPCPLPVAAVGNSLPLIDAPRLPLLLAVLAALPIDHLVRQKHAGANLNFFKLEQAAVPPPESYDEPAPWTGAATLGTWVLARFAAAVPADDALAALVAELTALGVDVAEARTHLDRQVALAELDAAHAVLLGWSRRELGRVLDTFTALRARETRTHGRFVTGVRVLEAYDRLAAAD